MRRREFVGEAARGVLAVAAVPLAGCKTAQRHAPRVSGAATHALAIELERELPRLMGEFNIPGASIAIVGDAEIVWRRGFGVKNSATKEPVTAETVFQAASMSKPVFAYAALKLCEKGVIGLDTPLSKYAPEPFLAGDDRLNRVTPRHLLSHTSGFPNWRSDGTPLKINSEPGSKYEYSGEGYYYLQWVITRLLGRVDEANCAEFEQGVRVCASDIDQFLSANILKPFGMKSSGYVVTDVNEGDLAAPHDKEGRLLPQSRPTRPAITRYASAGALLSTPHDYAKFIIEILKPRAPDEFRLNAAMIQEMLKPHAKVVNGPYTSSWALGWQIQDNGLFNHGGDNKGFHCHAIASRESKSAFVIMTNGDRGAELILQIFQSNILEGLFPGNA